MSSVSFLASIFGFVAVLPFILLAVVLLLASAAVPAGSMVLAVILGIVLCFTLSAGAFMCWGVLRSLCEIHKVLVDLAIIPEEATPSHAHR